MALPPEVMQQIAMQMQGQLSGNPLYQNLAQVPAAQGQQQGGWTPYDDVLAQLSQNPLLTQDPVSFYQSIGGENVRGYNQPDDITKLLGEQTGLVQDIGEIQAKQYEWRADEETRGRERRESQMQFGDPLVDASTFVDLQRRAGVSPADVAASLDPNDPDYVENVTALFETLKPMDPYSEMGEVATPDSSYGRVWLAEIRNALGQVAQDDMATQASEQAAAMEDQAFRKAYLGGTGDQGWTNTLDNQWFYGKGADKRAKAWEDRTQLSGDELTANREKAGAARATAREEYLERSKGTKGSQERQFADMREARHLMPTNPNPVPSPQMVATTEGRNLMPTNPNPQPSAQLSGMLAARSGGRPVEATLPKAERKPRKPSRTNTRK